MNKSLQILAGLVLGLIIPVFLLVSVITNISALEKEISYKEGFKQVVENFKSAKVDLDTPNDYALLSVLAAENANQKTMINKQVMKVAVIQIGFAVISIGLLFIVLGLNDGGIETSGGNGSMNFNMKSGSTGLVAIIVGAAMATLGGVIKNDYQTVEVPKYFAASSSDLENVLKACEKKFPSLTAKSKVSAVGECMKGYILSKKKY